MQIKIKHHIAPTKMLLIFLKRYPAQGCTSVSPAIQKRESRVYGQPEKLTKIFLQDEIQKGLATRFSTLRVQDPEPQKNKIKKYW